MHVVSGSVIQKINICTSSVWSVYIKYISLSYPSLPSVSAVSFGGCESIKIHDQVTEEQENTCETWANTPYLCFKF